MYAKSILFARIIRFIERNENLENTCMGYRRGEVNASKCAINRTQLISIMPLWSGLIWTILQSISYWNSFICCYLYAESDKAWYCVDYMVVYLTSNGCRKNQRFDNWVVLRTAIRGTGYLTTVIISLDLILEHKIFIWVSF